MCDVSLQIDKMFRKSPTYDYKSNINKKVLIFDILKKDVWADVNKYMLHSLWERY